MPTRTWTAAVADQIVRLIDIGDIPGALLDHPALRAMALVCAVAETNLRGRQVDNSVRAKLVTPGRRSPDRETNDLLKLLEDEITGAAGGAPRGTLSLARWRDTFDCGDFIASTIRCGLPDARRAALLLAVSQADAKLLKAVDSARSAHVQAIARRDLTVAGLGDAIDRLPLPRVRWLLAPERDGLPERPAVVLRRAQAVEAYGCVLDLLMTDAVTAVIDAGEPLAPTLMHRLGLSRAEVRALVGACEATEAVKQWKDRQEVVMALRDHHVPIHEWPGGGRPRQPAAWQTSRWVLSAGHGAKSSSLIRADYHGADPTQVHDAVEAFRKDLLRPLMGARLQRIGKIASSRPENFVRSMEAAWRVGGMEMDVAPRREFFALVRDGLIGPRRPKAFQEAVALWHRRSAAIAALRDECRSSRPGWPALSPPWRSGCGRYTIVALTSAQALVEEGKAHQHCVGGYYDVCRSGDTQILSLRDQGEPAATVEVLLGADWSQPCLTVGQFKGWRDQVAADPYHPVLRQFLADLRGGAHPINAAALASYRKWARDNVTPWSDDAMPLTFAQRVYPLYRALLPRPAPESFDEWAATSGLSEGLDRLIGRVVAQTERRRDQAA